MKDIEIIRLHNHGDIRGALYNIPEPEIGFPGKIQNIHFGKICPDTCRGNHYHTQSKEILIIAYSDTWTLAWAQKDSAEISQKKFTGTGAALIRVNEGIAHTVKNTGKTDLDIIALSNRIFSKENPDTFTRILLV